MKQNRYERKRQHIRELKRQHAILWGRYNTRLDEEHERSNYLKCVNSMWLRKYADPRNDGYQYWDRYYLSKSRRYARSCTNKTIRSKYRAKLTNVERTELEELEDIIAPRGSDYEKEFDYFWAIY